MTDAIDDLILGLVAAAGIDDDRDQVRQILASGVGLGQDGTDRLDLKITNATLAEMRAAFKIFAPYFAVPKVTIFGSARTKTEDPLYVQTHEVAAAMAAQGWMIVTGAGPGIMQAAMEGAGAERSIGVSIRLPFESAANVVIANDPKLVSMKYFFTRKLMLVKESLAFISMPGGFGTLDETLELLTLQQTGKAEPTPIVLLDVPGGGYWQGFSHFVQTELASRGFVSTDDLDRVLITDDVGAASREIAHFWSNYDSLRWVGPRVVLRLRNQPTSEEVAGLNDRFGGLLSEGVIASSAPLGPEVKDHDKVHLPRLVLALNPFKVGSLHEIIRAVNDLPSAPDS
ncbi:MAG: TIGR00730 family Rossman fold protein [Aquihabitans sp.]